MNGKTLLMSLLAAGGAAVSASALHGADAAETSSARSVSSATSAAVALDTRIRSAAESATLDDFGTKPLGAAILVR